MLPSGNEKFEHESNTIPIPQPVYKYLSGSTFLANLKSPNKQSFNVKPEFKFRDHVSNS